MFKIAVIVGSLRKDSFNKKLVHALDKLNHPNLQFNIINVNDVPLYNQDNENDLPTPVANFKNEITNADAVLFVTPEYNRSIPGVLKNLIDWGTRPYGKNVWANKPTAIIGTSPGAVGTAVAQSHLRSILVSIGAIVLGQPEVYFIYKNDLIDVNDHVTNEDTKKFLQGFLDKYSSWVESHQAKA